MATSKKKKLPPVIEWELDAGFFSLQVYVKARTKGEARKKAMAKLKRTSPVSFLNRKTTYLDKR